MNEDPQHTQNMVGLKMPGPIPAVSVRNRAPTSRTILLRVMTYGFVASLFFESRTFPFLRVSDTVTRNFGILLIAAFVVFVVLNNKRVGLTGADSKWFITFLVVVTVEEVYRFLTLGGAQAEASWRSFFSYAQVLVMYFVIRSISWDVRALRGVLATYFILLVGAATMTNLGVSRFMSETASGRVGVAGINVNQMAFLYAVLVVCVFSWVLGRWPRVGLREWAAMAASFSVVVALARTASRGGAFALLLGLAIALFVHLKVKKLPAYMFLVPLLLGGVAVAAISSPVMKERVESTFVEGDTGGRDVLTRGAMSMIKEKPLVGWGASYVAELGRVININRKIAAHNTYLQLMVSFGIFATVVLLVGIFMTVRRLWRRRDSTWEGTWFAVVTMMMGFGVVGHLGYDKHFWIVLALAPNIGLLTSEIPRRRILRHNKLGRRFHRSMQTAFFAPAGAENRNANRDGVKREFSGPSQDQASVNVE